MFKEDKGSFWVQAEEMTVREALDSGALYTERKSKHDYQTSSFDVLVRNPSEDIFGVSVKSSEDIELCLRLGKISMNSKGLILQDEKEFHSDINDILYNPLLKYIVVYITNGPTIYIFGKHLREYLRCKMPFGKSSDYLMDRLLKYHQEDLEKSIRDPRIRISDSEKIEDVKYNRWYKLEPNNDGTFSVLLCIDLGKGSSLERSTNTAHEAFKRDCGR